MMLRSPHWSPLVAAALLVVSLGLPWGSSLAWRTVYHPGWLAPSLCRTVQTWDGWYESVCEPSVLSTGFVAMEASMAAQPGAKHSGRFGVAAGLVLITLAWRLRRRHYLLLAAGAVAVITVLSSGLGFNAAGSGAAWMAVVLLLFGGLSTAPGPRHTEPQDAALPARLNPPGRSGHAIRTRP